MALSEKRHDKEELHSHHTHITVTVTDYTPESHVFQLFA